jgi:hypothetical protein
MELHDLTINVEASLTKYFKGYAFGIPVVFGQQQLEKDQKTKDRIEFLFIGPDYSRKGSQFERYGIIEVQGMAYTTMHQTDIYYHTRIKARLVQSMNANIPLKKIGESTMDRTLIGYLRPLPTEMIRVNPVSVHEPNASIVTVVYNIDLC